MSGATPRGPKGGKIRPGDPIRARWLNDTREVAERAVALGGGLVGTTADGRTVIERHGAGRRASQDARGWDQRGGRGFQCHYGRLSTVHALPTHQCGLGFDLG
jgi:hypothetical protein